MQVDFYMEIINFHTNMAHKGRSLKAQEINGLYMLPHVVLAEQLFLAVSISNFT